MTTPLVAPFPYFGGKRRLAAKAWELLGDVDSYVEPFFGSGAVLLARPGGAGKVETVNDLDGMVANFWRAVQANPEAVAHHADWPVNECDAMARHAWLVGQREAMTGRLIGDPDWCDPRAAGWWCWGLCLWIGGWWCSGKGPWAVEDGLLVYAGTGKGTFHRRVPMLTGGVGINRQAPHLSDGGRGDRSAFILEWMQDLAARLRGVRIACGDWQRVVSSDTALFGGPDRPHKACGVLLDPPYGGGYQFTVKDGVDAESLARDWAATAGERPNVRVVLCGYDDADMPATWARHYISGGAGYGKRDKAAREVLWASPSCLAGGPATEPEAEALQGRLL